MLTAVLDPILASTIASKDVGTNTTLTPRIYYDAKQPKMSLIIYLQNQ